MIELADFLREAESFLVSVAPRRRADTGHVGEACTLFPERENRSGVEEARRWMIRRFDAGFGFLEGPPELGGAGLTSVHQAAYALLEAEFAVPDTTAFDVSTGVIAPTILDWGSDRQKQMVRRLHRGDLIACQLFSEPDAGSDLASARTCAVRDGDGWRLSGAKVWTSGAHYADVGEVLCRTPDHPSGESRHRALTMFLLDMSRTGVGVRPLRQMTGSASFNEVTLDDVYVSDEDRLGAVGAGWRVAATTLSHERSGDHSGFFGRSSRSATRLLELARNTPELSVLARHRAAEAYTRERVLRLLMARTTDSANEQLELLLKLGLTENLRLVADVASEIAGPDLVASERDPIGSWSQFVLGVPGVRIAAGTDEIQRNVISERLLGLPR